jgi:hypothetical protein
MRRLIGVLALGPVAVVAAAPVAPGRPSVPGASGVLGRVGPIPPAIDELRLVFLEADPGAPVRPGAGDAGEATIDVGRLSAAGCPARGCVRTAVTRSFRMRVDGIATAARAARTYAFVEDGVPGHRVRIDGRLLTAGPQLIDAAIPLGMAMTHTLEIEVPVSEPEGPLRETIGWRAEDAR